MKKLLTSLLICGLLLGIAHAQYCLPTYSVACTSGDYINGVQFNTINNQNTGCANPGTNYSNYTNLNTSVLPGSSYIISLTPTPTWSQGFAVWIDYNQNLSFADPGELVFQSTAATNTTQTGLVTISAGAFPGSTRMRVLCRFATIPTASDYCIPNASFGECEDYTVIIGAPSPDDMGITTLTGPLSGCGLSANTPINVDITNFGTNTQSNPTVSFNVDGGAITTETTPYIIPSGSTFPYTFVGTADLSVSGFHTIKAWTNLPNDGFNLNDTTTLTVLHKPAINTYPYIQNFDVSGPTIPAGWENSVIDQGLDWAFTTGVTYPGPNPTADHTTGSTGYYAVVDDNTDYDSTILITPCFDLAGLLAPEFSFWSHSFNATNNAFYDCDLHIDLNHNGAMIYDVISPIANQGNMWTLHVVDLTPYIGEIVAIRFRADNKNNNGYTHNLAIDDIGLKELLPNDAQAFDVTAPLSSCGLTYEQITTEIVNVGTTSFNSIPLSYQIDGGTWVNETYNGVNVNPYDTLTYTFVTLGNLSAFQIHDITVVTHLPGDTNYGDDTVTVQVENIPVVSVYPYQENFDQNSGGWSAFGTNSTWEWGAPAGPTINAPYSAPNVWTTNLTGYYSNNDASHVLSPCFDFTALASPVIEMAVWWNSENSWDGAVLQSTINNGVTWQNVGAYLDPVNWYNFQNLITSPGAPFNPNSEAWNGTSSPGWLVAKHDLTGLAGQSAVRLRIAFSSDGSVNYDGFAFDNVLIYDKPPLDFGIIAMGTNTPLSLCSSPTTPIEVIFENFGSQAQSNIQVVVEITGPVNTTLSGTYAPVVPVGGTATFMVGSLNTSAPGVYYLTAYTSNVADGLHLNDTAYYTISVSPTPVDPVVNNAVTCFPDSLLLIAGGNPAGVDYFWYDAITGGNLLAMNDSFQTPFLTVSTTYYVVGKSKVAFKVGPVNNNFGPGGANSFPNGNGLIFDVLNPDGATIDSVLIYPGSAGLMNVSITSLSGQLISATDIIVPTPAFPGEKMRVPVGVSVPFGTGYTIAANSVPGSLFYNYGGAVYPYTDAGNNVSITNTTSNFGVLYGYYYFFYDWDISAYTCESNTVPVNALVGVSPPVNLGPDAIICGSYPLNATTVGGITYSWSTGQTTANINAANNGIYAVAVTDVNGCIGTDSININILPSPTVDLGPDVNGCSQTTILDAGAQSLGSSYLWSANANYSNTQTVTISTAGTYSVTVVNPAGCTDSDTVNVALNGVDANLGPDIVSCSGSVLLNAGNIGANYSWSTGALTQTINVTTAGNYTVIVSKNGCVDVDVINISFGAAPVVDLGPDITDCDITTLDAGIGGNIYSWSNGANTQIVNVTQTGTYNVSVSIGNGCATTDQINVTIYQSPTANFTYTNPQPAVYNFSSLTTTGSLPFTYSWNFGDGTTSNLQNPQHTYALAGGYQVTLVVTHATCGSSTTQKEITSITSIEDGTLSGEVSIYPNPNNGIFTIASADLQAATFSIQVTDVQGRSVYYNVLKNVNGFSQEINLTALAKGVYIVKLSDGTRSGYTRVIIE